MAIYLLILCVLLLPFLSYPVELFSDKVYSKDGEIIAEGKVEVRYGNYIIRADRIKYVPDTKEVFAYGNVKAVSVRRDAVIQGSFGYLNLATNKGYFLNVKGKLEKFYVSADRLEQEGKNKYRIYKADITTCPPQDKEVKLCIGKASFDSKYVYSTGNSLRFFGFPALYLPLAIFPAGDRRSGFLLPMIGSNTYNSFIYRQPIYWAISRDKDLTLTLDIRDKQAKGIELEYRQAFSEHESLFTTLSLYKEPSKLGEWWKGRDKKAFRENRFRFQLRFNRGNLTVGMDTVSDPYFLEDIYFSQYRRTKPYLTSYLSYTLENDVYLASLNVRRYQDLTYLSNRSAYVLPQVGFYLKKKKLRWVYFGLSAEYMGFDNGEGLRGNRLKLDPEISLPFKLSSLSSLFTLRGINTFYRTEDKSYDSSVNTFLLENRTFTFRRLSFGSLDVGNLFEFVYTFQPRNFNNPRFDRLDVVNKRNDLNLRYRASLSYRGRALGTLFLSAGYNYLATYKFPTDNEVIEKNWLPMRLIASVNLPGNIYYYQDIIYDPNLSIVAKNTGSIRYESENYSFNIGFVNNKNSLGESLSNQISFGGKLERKRVFSGIQFNYDLREGKALYRELYVGYKGACWSLSLILRSTYYGLREDYVNELYLGINIFDLKTLTVPLSRN